ncbi:MAG: hypothetical protein IPK23_05735 [Rhizobiales bacterium]|nr:hypothetical protein [Hyphomicrobiales bacterium]
MDSSSDARATARSMPSPRAATSRRIAWPTETMASVETPSGSARRSVTSVIAREMLRISCERRTSMDVMKKRSGGRKIAASVGTKLGCTAISAMRITAPVSVRYWVAAIAAPPMIHTIEPRRATKTEAVDGLR